MTEALGLSLPGCATIHAVDARKMRIAKKSGMKIVELIQKGLTARKIVSAKSMENAVRVDMAIGGSTNTVLHLPAIAAEFGLELELDVFDRISRETPHLVNLRPGGPYHLIDLERAGGIPAVMNRLKSKLNLDVMTVTGRTMGEEIAEFCPINPKAYDEVIATLGVACACRRQHSHTSWISGPRGICG